MTKLSKTSEEPKAIYCDIKEIISIEVDGNTTYILVEIPIIVDENGRTHVSKQANVEIPTLELIQTFNATWVNHAIFKLKHWLNQIVK